MSPSVEILFDEKQKTVNQCLVNTLINGRMIQK